VLVNLIRNAAEALPEGGRILVRTSKEADRVIAEVIDNGVGIPREIASRVFEPFLTTDSSRSGIGLAVSSGIVHRHGGRITIKSGEGIGTAAIVTLPSVNNVEEEGFAEEKPRLLRSLRILLINDHEPTLRQLEKGLRDLGQTPITALSGRQGLVLFEKMEVDANFVSFEETIGHGLADEPEIDAVVCALKMREMSGVEVSRGIQTICLAKDMPKPPVFMIAGNDDIGPDEAPTFPDADGILEPPVDAEDLFNVIMEEVRPR
jgi:CheY-like chemotaxis protein